MNKFNKTTDMLHGSLAKGLLEFAVPIALTGIVQQLFSAADTAAVGFFGNANALAAVGTNTECVALAVTLSAGLAVGANVLAAEAVGRGEQRRLAAIARSAVVLAIIAGIIGLAVGQTVAEPLLRLIKTPQSVLPEAVKYLRVYFAGYPFLLLYDFGAAVLRARGDSRYPFAALLASGVINVALNLAFVAVFDLGVAGVAAATDISNAVSALLVLLKLRRGGLLDFSAHRASDERSAAEPQVRTLGADIAQMLKLGVPSAVQGAVFCLANIFVQAAVNRFGTSAIAGSAIAMNFEYIYYYIITAFGQAATTFTAQNRAAGQLIRCRKILAVSLALSLTTSAALIAPVIAFRAFFCGLFSSDAAVVGSACVRVMSILLFEPLCSLYETPAGVMRGLSHAVEPAVCTVAGTCLFRIAWIATVFAASPALELLYRAFPLSWAVTSALVAVSFAAIRPFRKAARQA